MLLFDVKLLIFNEIRKYLHLFLRPTSGFFSAASIEVAPVSVTELARAPKGEPSASIRERVIAARAIQTERYKNEHGVHCNAQMSRAMIEQFAQLDAEAAQSLQRAMRRLDLSARAYDRILKVARTIADLDASPQIAARHIKEAIGYRSLDRGDWGE